MKLQTYVVSTWRRGLRIRDIARDKWRDSPPRKWLSLHFRLLECAGLLTMLLAGALEYRSIRVDERLTANLNAEVIADWSVSNVVSPMQRHWIQESAQRIGEEVGTATTDARAKRQIASFAYNYGTYIATAAMLLNETVRTLLIFETDTGIVDRVLADACNAAAFQVNQSLADLQQGLVKEISAHTLAGDLVHFVENFETSIYITQIAEASKLCFLRREFDLKALSERKRYKSNVYMSIFLFGSILLVLGKFGNWLNDCDRVPK